MTLSWASVRRRSRAAVSRRTVIVRSPGRPRRAGLFRLPLQSLSIPMPVCVPALASAKGPESHESSGGLRKSGSLPRGDLQERHLVVTKAVAGAEFPLIQGICAASRAT
jgi:hypothetical protein